MFLRILLILILLLIDYQPTKASDWKKNARFQIAIGGEENIFESLNYKIADQYFRGFLTQNWINTNRKSTVRLKLTAWGAVYSNHSVENKYFFKLANQNSISIKPNLIWQINGESQIKKFVQLDHGFWRNFVSTGFLIKLSKKANIKINGSFDNYQFFAGNQFNLSKYTGGLTFVHLLQPQIHLICGINLGKVILPNRRFIIESFDYESQNDQFYSLDFGLNYRKNLFFNGLLHLEKQKSNFSGLDYFLIYSNITFAYKLFTKLYVRSNLRFQIKSYKGGFRPDQMISIDPEVGEGSTGNIDFVYSVSPNFSIIFRSRLLRQESVFRNKYYSNQIFEIMLEIK